MTSLPSDSLENRSSFGEDQLLSKWKEIQGIVESQLCRYLDELSDDCPKQLREAMAYSLLSAGKRLRPVLAFLACESVSGSFDGVLPAACALEMIHSYSLIHDDLPAMDDDDLRRGLPTCHKQFDEATAILAGDGLQALAFETLACEIHPPEVASQMIRCLARAAGPEGMVGGQMDDLLAENITDADRQLLESIHRRKTGCMIKASSVLGGLAGGASSEQLQLLANFGAHIGVVFQIVDDILDVTACSQSMGKRTRKDSEQGKLTYPRLFGLNQSQALAASITETAVANLQNGSIRSDMLIALARYILNRSH